MTVRVVTASRDGSERRYTLTQGDLDEILHLDRLHSWTLGSAFGLTGFLTPLLMIYVRFAEHPKPFYLAGTLIGLVALWTAAQSLVRDLKKRRSQIIARIRAS